MGRRLSDILLPYWLAWPLMFLGFLFVALPILFLDTWFEYLFALGIAAGLGIWSRLRYRVQIERPVDGLVITRVEDRKHYKATSLD